jgi:hypothetical protein
MGEVETGQFITDVFSEACIHRVRSGEQIGFRVPCSGECDSHIFGLRAPGEFVRRSKSAVLSGIGMVFPGCSDDHVCSLVFRMGLYTVGIRVDILYLVNDACHS